jgi:hypothetical protein
VISAYLRTQGGAALAASVAGGHAGVPNGYRFGYLADAAAVAAAAGVLCVLALVAPARRRAAALAALGLVAASGALSARDALVVWPQRLETFDGFHGQDTLIARAALRWTPYGSVTVEGPLGHSPITIDGIRRYELEPNRRTARVAAGGGRCFRIAAPETAAGPGERVVERVSDVWGREWAVVLGRACRRS